ncbi:MAG: TlpA disulfide reductase family protein [Deltaproteobacteria bacterium]|nr:TlpA disulfide reductase family protein [Deltaproteobacteria bacterium]
MRPKTRRLTDRRPRTAALWLPVLLLALLAVVRPAEATAALRIGSSLPSVTLTAVNGMAVKIPESVKGKVVILHFWQIGCSSCKLEMPVMDELYGKNRQKGLEVLAVNVGQNREKVKSFAAELGVSYPLLIDAEKKSAALYGVTDVPRTYVVDRKGIVRYRILGSASAETLKKLVFSLL